MKSSLRRYVVIRVRYYKPAKDYEERDNTLSEHCQNWYTEFSEIKLHSTLLRPPRAAQRFLKSGALTRCNNNVKFSSLVELVAAGPGAWYDFI